MTLKSIGMTVVVCALCAVARAQSPLAKAFADIKNTDPTISGPAKAALINVLVSEMPVIEQDTATLCNALQDSDPYVRLQASGILQTIVLAAPSHNQVVVACTSGLIKTASDTVDRVRNNSLFTLAMNPAGPPQEAQQVFEQAIKSENYRTAEIGAAGLLREDEGKNTSNIQLVEQELVSAPDANHRLNMLYAIGGSGVQSDQLFEASRQYLSDSNSDVQNAAFQAVAATSTDHAKLLSVMENVVYGTEASPNLKRQAKGMLETMQHPQTK
jgi:hypothetical protein